MNWKIPAWAAAGGAVVSLAAGLAGGNRFGTVVLRAVVSALVAGALGLAGRHLLRRFLPELGAGAPQSAQPGVDILVDEEIPLDVVRAEGEAEQAPEAELQADDGLGLGELGPAEEEPFPAPAGGLDLGSGPSGAQEAFAGSGELAGLEAAEESLEPLEAEELPSGESLEALAPAEPDDGLSGTIAEPGRRALKAEELEAQLDSVTKGQDPASLAKAVRTFLRKDQEG